MAKPEDIADLIELAEEAMSYVSPYFRDKWDMDKRLNDLKAKLSDPKQAE